MDEDSGLDERVPLLPIRLRRLAAGSLLVILVFGAGWVLVRVGSMVSQVLIPLVVGMLIAALLMPLQVLLNHRLRFPRYAGATTIVVGLLVVIGATFYFAGRSIGNGFDEVRVSLLKVLDDAESWLATGPFGLDAEHLQSLLDQGRAWLQANWSILSSGAFNATSSLGNVVVGGVLALIITLFLLAEGDRICSWLLMIVRQPFRTKVRETIRRSWVTLGSWARTQVIVSGVDAVGIGIGAAALGLPFVVPMVVITFLLCFIPMFGAFLSGAMFTLLALLFKGPIAAVIMLAVVITVQQLENNLLQPLLMGRAVNLHPLVVLLGVTTGTFLLGLTGALLAVPVLAACNAGYTYWVGRDPFPGLASGGSAMTGSPRTLVAARKPAPLPSRLGAVTPEWIEEEREAMAASAAGVTDPD